MIVEAVAVVIAAAVVYFDRASLKARAVAAEKGLAAKFELAESAFRAAAKARVEAVFAELANIPAEIVAKIKAAI